MQNKDGQYISTYLSKNKGKLECFVGGLKHFIRTHRNNIDDGFYFQNCKQINFIHSHGTVYLYKEHGYVCVGAYWFRFIYTDFLLLSN